MILANHIETMFISIPFLLGTFHTEPVDCAFHLQVLRTSPHHPLDQGFWTITGREEQYDINITRPRTHLWPDAGCIHRQRPTNIV